MNATLQYRKDRVVYESFFCFIEKNNTADDS